MPPRRIPSRRVALARRASVLAGLVALVAAGAAPADAQAARRGAAARAARAARAVPRPPSAVLGLEVGADRTLADWSQITRYFADLDAASPAVRVETIGRTTQGRPFIMAAISTPANLARLEAIRRAQARLADPRVLTTAEERRLVATQPAVIFISCNIHATEIASSQMAMELAHRLATNDTLQRLLDDVVVLLVPSMNPDGQQLVTEWYRQQLGTRWEGGPLPWLYHHYVGHDNNRDWYMITQRETRLVTDQLYRRWFPVVFYDVHQQGQTGMRLTVPPHVDPIDPNVDPLIVRGINHVGAEMSLALESAGKTGVGDGVTYDLWWHGGARSAPTRHNIVGLLTEAASVNIATPVTLDSSRLRGHARGLPRYERRINFPNPWPGGTWRLRDIMDYELIAAEALVRLASQQREQYVRNYVTLGRRQVELGRTQAPFGWRIPKAQHDRGAARTLVDVLAMGGVEVRDAGEAWVIDAAQPYRAHAKDLLEIQRFPRMERWPGGPPERPYDVAGWTLSLQMGVDVQELGTAPANVAALPLVAPSALAAWRAPGAPAASAANRPVSRRAALTLACDRNDVTTHRALWSWMRAGGRAALAPTQVLLTTDDARVADSAAAATREAGCHTADARPVPGTTPLERLPRVGVYRPWTSNMDEGWTRWVLERFEVPYVTVTDSVIKAGRLRDQLDVLIVPDMTLRDAREGVSAARIPPPYAGGLGAEGIAELGRFATGGGTLVLFDRASEIATEALGVAVRRIAPPPRDEDGNDDDAARTATGAREPLYAPGSIFRVLIDGSHLLAAGMRDTAAVYFTNSTTFDVPEGSAARVIARYPARADDVLLSGFLQGGASIAGRAAAVEVPMGQGRAVLLGFRPQYRGQSYGTFKLLFNALLPVAEAQR